MASTPATELAQEILDACLADGTWPTRALDALITRALDEEEPFTARAATRALFSIVVEHLADLFEPQLCDVYAGLFAHVVERTMPDCPAKDVLVRYRQIRQIRRFRGGEVNRVFVLSRVTLGADVAVTSVVMNAAKERFPDAEICLVGPEKNAELFAADPVIRPVPVAYGRGAALRDRLAAAVELRTLVDFPASIVIDPDSRLTQLGLIPICDDSRYFFFESRAYGGDLDGSLPSLTAEWMREVFDTPCVRPYVAPSIHPSVADVAVSFGVGENQAKRMGGDFEFHLLQELLRLGHSVVLDRGAGGEEGERVERLAARLRHPEKLHVHEGTYASFASHILQSRFYVGYDSAGQHVAAAAGVPLVSVFAGYACERMFSRWSPDGPNAQVVRVADDEAERAVLDRTIAAIGVAAAAARAGSKGRS